MADRRLSDQTIVALETLKTKRYVVGQWVRLVVTVVPCICVVLIVVAIGDYPVPTVKAIASAVVRIFGEHALMKGLGLVALLLFVQLGYLRWRHADRRIAHTHKRVQNAERLEDKHRTSAHLTDRGHTVPVDGDRHD